MTDNLRSQIACIGAKAAAECLNCSEEEEEFYERLFIIDRMGREEIFMKDVVYYYKQINHLHKHHINA